MANVQISIDAFRAMRYMLFHIDRNSLTKIGRGHLEELERELNEKAIKMKNRMRYFEVLKADDAHERKELLNLYHSKKGSEY